MKTGIEWTDTTWNPVTGCTKVSAGCKNCYAERLFPRIRHVGARTAEQYGDPSQSMQSGGPRKFSDVQCHPDRLDAPLRWRKPRKVFVNSMSDLFHDAVPDEFIDRVFGVMALAPQHTFQVLTKRPKRMRAYLAERTTELVFLAVDEERATGTRQTSSDLSFRAHAYLESQRNGGLLKPAAWPLPNVWLGVSCEDQKAADERIPLLLQTPAAVRFISAEPLLGQLDIGMSSATCKCCDRWPSRWIRLHRPVGPDLPHLVGTKGGTHVADCGIYRAHSNPHGALSVMTPGGLLGIKPAEFDCLPGIDWVIVGGESGPGARPCEVAWIRSIVEQCKAAGVACFVKQLGAKPVARDRWDMSEAVFVSADAGGWDEAAGSVVMRLRDHKGGDPSEWPEELRVREFPR